MSSTPLRISSAALLFSLGLSLTGSASADTKSCVQAHATAQREVKGGRLKEAAQEGHAAGKAIDLRDDKRAAMQARSCECLVQRRTI